jgi:uncharacterized protein
MGKIIFWVVIALVAMFAARIYNTFKAKSKEEASRPARRQNGVSETMVQCANCGVFVPKSQAIKSSGKFYCDDCQSKG